MASRNLDGDVERGARAKAILEDEVFASAYNDLREELLQVWERTPSKDAETRERLWLSVKLLHRLRAQLELYATGGKLATAEIVQIDNERRRKGAA